MVMATPQNCKYPDSLCNECPVALECKPVDPNLLHRDRVVVAPRASTRRKSLPAFLNGASESVRASYGY
jgi:hypothetical protein